VAFQGLEMSATELLLPQDVIELAEDLRERGYSIGVGECISAQRLMISLAAQGAPGLGQDTLATWLAPVFCTTPAEQEQFYKYYAEWLTRRVATIGTTNSVAVPLEVDVLQLSLFRGIARWQWICLAIAASLVVLAGVATYHIHELLLTRTLMGTVVDERNHRVENAAIHFKAQESISGADGNFTVRFRLYDLPADVIATSPSSQRIPAVGSLTIDRKNFNEAQQVQLRPLPVDTGNRAEREQRSGTPEVISPVNTPWQQLFYEFFPWIRAVLIVVPVLAMLGWLFWMYLPRLQLVRWTSKRFVRIDHLFVSNFGRNLYGGNAFRHAMQGLRRHRRVDSLDLDAERTVNASAQNAGWFTPVCATRQTLPEYLVLIDRVGYHDMQARLIEELVTRLRLENVLVERYYFCEDPRFCQSHKAGHEPSLVQDLAAKHPDTTLIIFGDGAGMFSSLTGRVYPWVDLFSAWPERVFLFPDDPLQAASATRLRKRVLEDCGFSVFPATLDGISRLAEHIHTGELPQPSEAPKFQSYPELLLEDPLRWVDRLPPDPSRISRLLGQLRRYLGSQGFYWLIACAIYPQLNWDLMLYFGHRLEILPEDESRLSALIRLPWFRHGAIPNWLRERLVSALPSEVRGKLCGELKRLLLTALDHPEDPVILEVAYAPSTRSLALSRWRDWLLRNFIRTEDTDSPLRDYVLVDFLYGSASGPRSIEVPNAMQNLLRQYAQPRRPFIQSVLAVVLAVISANALRGVHPPKPPEPLIADSPLVPPLPNDWNSRSNTVAASLSATRPVSLKDLPGLVSLVNTGKAHVHTQNGHVFLCLQSKPASGDLLYTASSDPVCPYQLELIFPEKVAGKPCVECQFLLGSMGQTSGGPSSKTTGVGNTKPAADVPSAIGQNLGVQSPASTEASFLQKLTDDEREFGANAPQVGTDLLRLAIFYLNSGQYQKADPLLQKALEIDRAAGNLASEISDLSNLGWLYLTLDRGSEGERYYQEALSIARKISDRSSERNILNNLASLYVKETRYTEAQPLYQNALAIGEQLSGPDSADVVESLTGLASVYAAAMNYKDAENLYRRALEIDGKTLGTNDPRTANDLRALSKVLQAQGNSGEAASLLERAVEIEKGTEAHGNYASSGVSTVRACGAACTENTCSPSGCARCVQLSVSIPVNAVVKGWHCMTTAAYPKDNSRLQEVPCGQDVAWSIFDAPTQEPTGQNTAVHTTYHNRSGDRSRQVEFLVDYGAQAK
jgi:Tfp pilus assembly protein PilF